MLRLTITYIVLSAIRTLPGIRIEDALFCTWIASLAFVLLSRFVRPLLLALTLPLTITTAGLFIFVIDGILLLLTDLLTGLEIASFGWAIVGSVAMGIMNIWVESAFKRLGWLERESQDDPAEIESPGWALRVLLGLGLLLGIVFSGLTAFQTGLALSTLTSRLAVLGGATLAILALASWAASWLIAEGLEAANRARFSGIVAGLTTLIGAALLILVVRDPVPPPPPPAPLPETDYWELPTGSTIAFYHYPASPPAAGPPVVYLHDGPGFAVLEPERAFYRQLTHLGFDVYLFDRVGTGLSSRLPDVEAYGINRDIADLDAVRDELGVEEMILVGQGFGAELAARYLSRFPERVHRAVLISPTRLSNAPTFHNYGRTASPTGVNPVLEPRLLFAQALAPFGPDAAQKLASQTEMRVLVEQAFDPRTWVCPGDADYAPEIGNPGFNAYVELRKDITQRALPDPRPPLADNLTPALILAAECDFLPWDVIREYREALLNETIFYVEDAGHMIQLTQEDLMIALIRSFLLDLPYPIEPYAGDRSPRPSLGP
jgi:proline iminopeptidase